MTTARMISGWAGSDSAELEGVDRCSGEFRPLSRPNPGALEVNLRPPGRGIEETEEGHPTRRPAGGPGGGLTGLCRRFPLPPVGGESASSAPAGREGKVPVSPAEISRRWRLRGGAGWRQRRSPILARTEAPALSGVRPYQAQQRLF